MVLFFFQSLLSKSTLPLSGVKISRHQRSLRFSCTGANLMQVPSVNVNPFTPETVRRNSEQHLSYSIRSDEEDDRLRYMISKVAAFQSLYEKFKVFISGI